MSNNIAIKVEGVSKTFKLPHEKQTSIKSLLINFRKRKKGFEKQQVLDDISFEIKKGEFFGIVGRNGSGKSTLLKLLSGIYTPDSGGIQVNGKLTPFIELGVGFNPELSGRENVYLNGALLGFSRKEMEAMYDEIVEFAELERFMDQKLKNYSSGMQVRLAFSIAIRAQGDILLLDEVLAVGDAAFQQKCVDYFKELKKRGQTVVLVTHAMDNVEKYCTRAMLIDAGEIVHEGDPALVSAKYQMLNLGDSQNDNKKEANTGEKIKITKVDVNGDSVLRAKDSNIRLNIQCVAKKSEKFIAGFSVVKNDGTYVSYFNTKNDLGLVSLGAGEKITLTCEINTEQLIGATYMIDVALYDADMNYLDRKGAAVSFILDKKIPSRGGVVKLDAEWINHQA